MAVAGEGHELVPLPTSTTRSWPCTTAPSTAPSCPSRTRSRDRSTRRWTRSRSETEDVRIVGEVVHRVRHCLIAREPVAEASIETVVSHPQATAQCARFLRTRLPNAAVLPANSTADAVRQVAESSAPWAALGNRLSAVALRLRGPGGRRGGHAGEQDALRLARAGRPGPAAPAPGRHRSCSGAPATTPPGWLVRCLSEFAFRGVNLTMIESRPRKQGLGHYMFFADLEGRETRRPGLRGDRGRARADRAPAHPRVLPGGLGAGTRLHRRRACRRRSLHSRPRMGVKVDPVPPASAPLDGHRRRGREYGRVLVLNATFEPINVCTVRRAAVLLLKDKAEVVEHASWELRSESLTLPRPVVIRLVTYVRVPRDTHRRKITRRAVFARDRWTCQYCGSRGNLTVDHVVPRSKGGPSSWDNIVTSCAPCNRRKGDRLLRHVGHEAPPRAAEPQPPDLHPRRQPHHPHGVAAVPARGGVGASAANGGHRGRPAAPGPDGEPS